MIINHIDLPYGFNVGSREPIDARFILSQADMAKVGDASQGDEYALARWPEHYFVLCEDDNQIYEFHKDAAAPNGCVFTRLTRKIDNKTIRENADLEAFVKIDNKTIKYDSEVGLHAIPEALENGVATEVKYTSEGAEKVDVLFDPATIELLTALNQLAVKYDHDTIKVGSEGLYVDFDLLPDNVTIKMNSEGKLAGQYAVKPNSALRLNGVEFDVVPDGDTIITSEGKLHATFLHYVGSEGVAVEDEVIKAVVDDKTIKVVNGALEVQVKEAIDKDADGLFVKVDGRTVVLDSENKLHVPVVDLVEAEDPIKVTVANDKAKFELKIDDTLEVNSEGKLHAVARQAVASEGIIVQPVDETSIISVDFDHKSIRLGSEGLYVKLADDRVSAIPASGIKLGNNGLYVSVDGQTLKFNSEGRLYAEATPLTPKDALVINTVGTENQIKVLYDGETILLNSENELYVPIDEDTIIVSEGKIKAKKQLKADNITIVEDSEHIISANVDEKTIISTRGFLETAVGGWKEAATHKIYLNNNYSGTAPIFINTSGSIFEGEISFSFTELPLDSSLVDIDLDLQATGTSVIHKTLTGWSVTDFGTTLQLMGPDSATDKLVSIIYDKATGKAVIKMDINTPLTKNNMQYIDVIDSKIEGDAATYHTVDPFFIPVDNNSIVIKGGKLVTSAPSITAGDGLEYVITPTANILNVLTDSESIDISGDHLYIPVLTGHTPAEEDLVLTINSEGKPEFLKRAGVTDVQIDGQSLVNNYVVIIPNASDSERGVIKFDGDTLVLNSEGQLKVVNLTEDVLVKEITSEGTSEYSVLDADRVAHVDLTPYSKLNETGYRIRLLVDGSEAPSEGVYDSESEYKVTAELYDQDGNLLTTSNVLDLPLEKTIVNVTSRSIPTSEGTSETTLIFHFMDESTVEIPLAAIVSGFITIHGDYTGTNSIYGTKNFEGELMNYGQEVITQVQVDNKTIFWNDSEVYLEAILPEGRKAIELVDLGSEFVYDVKYDDLTVKVNSENELFVPIDEKTIVLEGGKVKANIDKKTIIYDDSEGHIELPIDNITITLNSEGFLEASGLDVKAGDAIKITTSEEAGLPVKYLDVLYNDITVKLNSENELYVPIDEDSIIINSENLIEVKQYTVAEIRALWHTICSEGEA